MLTIFPHWPLWFRELYGGSWPKNYLSLDIETTGGNLQEDVITQFGHCLVQDGKIVDKLELTLNWTKHAWASKGVVPPNWLRQRLHIVRRNMEASGRLCHMTWDLMQEEGRDPGEVMIFYRDLLRTFQEKELVFVLHNGKSDESMISANFAGFEIDPNGFEIGRNALLDTAFIEKAHQVGDLPKSRPVAGDSLRSYWSRLHGIRTPDRSVKYNLDDHCRKKYDFDSKGIDPAKLHQAGTDSECLCLLMEIWRPFADELPQEGTPPAWFAPKPAKPLPARPAPLPSSPKTETKLHQPNPGILTRRRGQRNS